MLVEELNPALVDTPRNLLADLVRRPPFDHVQPRPPILGLRTGRCADEERILELSLQVVSLHMIGEDRGYLSVRELSRKQEGPSHETYLGYPTPVKPDQPTYAPWGNKSIRSSAFASFVSMDGRRTRLFNNADAVAMVARRSQPTFRGRGLQLLPDVSTDSTLER